MQSDERKSDENVVGCLSFIFVSVTPGNYINNSNQYQI